jgi:cell wall-associated NlpC family hydrolase
MTTENNVTTNEFVPTLVVRNSKGQATTNPDLAFDTFLENERNFSSLLRRNAYERLNDSAMARSNPNFHSGAAGRLTSIVTSENGGGSAKISRGYIRRSNKNDSDPTDGYRLYFMFNPEMIERNYVAYLEQAALDPFNTIYGSNNLVAPPGVLDFSFDLFFDRQIENANGTDVDEAGKSRGVLMDYEYFDLVVRGVVPDGSNATPQLQDSGVMMINPRNITVVFSPQLSVQGRAYRASVTYSKFDHQMTPIRMTISLSMKVFYFGPVRSDFEFSSTDSTATYEATIPYDENLQYEVTYSDVEQALLTDDANILNASSGVQNASNTLGRIGNISIPANGITRMRALTMAEQLGESTIPYDQLRPIPNDPGPNAGLDCSGLVIWAYTKIGALESIGQSAGSGRTSTLLDAAFRLGTVIAGQGTFVPFNDEFFSNYLQPGDLLISKEMHVAFVKEVIPERRIIKTYESTPPWRTVGSGGPRHLEFSYGAIYGKPNLHTHAIRPGNVAADTIGNLGLRV